MLRKLAVTFYFLTSFNYNWNIFVTTKFVCIDALSSCSSIIPLFHPSVSKAKVKVKLPIVTCALSQPSDQFDRRAVLITFSSGPKSAMCLPYEITRYYSHPMQVNPSHLICGRRAWACMHNNVVTSLPNWNRFMSDVVLSRYA